MKRVAPSPMYSSKTQEANPGPACGRAVTGMLLIETSTAGRLRSDSSETTRPVSGFTPDGKFSASGPYVTAKLRGCGVAVTGKIVGVTAEAVSVVMTKGVAYSVWVG